MRRALLGLALPLTLLAGPAAAEVGFALHAEAGAALAVGDRADQFGWGGSGLLAPELRLHPKLGVELPVGFVSLGPARQQDPAYLRTTAGSAVFLTPGIRLRPFATVESPNLLWLAAGAGISDTSGLVAPAVDVRVGADLRLGPLAIGPQVGFLQLVNIHGGVRPDDARMVTLGLHGSLERRSSRAARPSDGPDDVDGTPEMWDRCPNDPETRFGYDDDRPCPEIAPSKDVVIEDSVELEQRVHFAFFRSTIPAEEHGAVAAVAKLVKSHEDFVRVRIAGHSDESGDDRYNARLSRLRGQAVWAELVHLGVDARKLEVVAFGKSRPRLHERSAAAQRENRRVEFEVLRRRLVPKLTPEEEARAR